MKGLTNHQPAPHSLTTPQSVLSIILPTGNSLLDRRKSTRPFSYM
jgi:hypothetical protein